MVELLQTGSCESFYTLILTYPQNGVCMHNQIP